MARTKSDTVALWVGGLLVVGLLSSAFGGGDDASDTTTTEHKKLSETVFSDESCYAQSAELLAKYPSVYYSRQEAYDGCRRGGKLADEIVGEVDRH